jgi:hypothetical protein
MGANSIPTDYRSIGTPIDAEYVIGRLERANLTLLSLPGCPGPAGIKVNTYGYTSDSVEAGKTLERSSGLRQSFADEISRMDEEAARRTPNVSCDRAPAQSRIAASHHGGTSG